MQQDILHALLVLIPMILSLSVHEYAHAKVASMLEDSTADEMGRLTLNPVAHIDPIGTIALPFLGVFLGGFIFGWAKPVPVNPMNFTRRISMKKGMLLVAAAGPASNFAMAIAASVLLYLLVGVGGYNFVDDPFKLMILFGIFIKLNIILAFFNLLPVPPLDGGRILAGILPDSAQPHLRMLEQYGFLIVIMLLFSGALQILFIPASWISNFLFSWPLI